jgi:hypothetical protein
MGKLVAFFVFLLIISIYPIVEVFNVKVTKTSYKKFVSTAIFDGNYSFYNPFLERDGRFKEVDIYSKKFLKAFDLWINDYIKKEKIFGSEFLYKDEILKGRDVNFFTTDYNLSTVKGIYFVDKRELRGGEFVINGEKFFGKGESFFVDKDKNIFANKITYYLKVKQ